MKNYKKLKQLKPDTFKAMLQECELSHERKKSKRGIVVNDGLGKESVNYLK